MKKTVSLIFFVIAIVLLGASIAGGVYFYTKNRDEIEINKLRLSLDKREQELGELKSGFKEAVFKNKLLTKEKDELEKKVALVKMSVIELDKQKSEITKQIGALYKEKKKLEKRMGQVSVKTQGELALEKKNFEKELKSIEEKYSNQLQENIKQFEELKKQLALLEGRKQVLENTITQAMSDVGREKLKFYHYQLARAYEYSSNFENAIDEYKKVLALDPDNADTYLDIATIYTYKIKDIYKAEFYAKKYAKLKAMESAVGKRLEDIKDEKYVDIPVPFLKEKLADVSFTNVELQNRIDYLQKRVSENQKLITNLKNIADNKEVIEKALKQLEAKLKKEALRYHYNLALAYDHYQDYKNASKEYLEALKIAPEDADTHYNLAILYDDHLDDKRNAIFHYEEYLKLCPRTSPDVEKVQFWLSRAKREIEEDEKDVVNLNKVEKGYEQVKAGIYDFKSRFINAKDRWLGTER